MRELVSKVGLAIFLCMIIMVMIKPFKIDETKFTTSIWSKLFAGYFFISIWTIFIYMYLANKLAVAFDVSSIGMAIFPFYALYATLKFKYEINTSAITWFNGLWVRRIVLNDLSQVNLLKKKGKIVKIEFMESHKGCRMRNDLSLDNAIVKAVKKKGVTVVEKQIKWFGM